MKIPFSTISGVLIISLFFTCFFLFHEDNSSANIMERDSQFYNLIGRYPHNQTWIFDGERYYYIVLKDGEMKYYVVVFNQSLHKITSINELTYYDYLTSTPEGEMLGRTIIENNPRSVELKRAKEFTYIIYKNLTGEIYYYTPPMRDNTTYYRAVFDLKTQKLIKIQKLKEDELPNWVQKVVRSIRIKKPEQCAVPEK
ncbi:hypothetical protein [Thermococcus sp.]